ncbi:transposase [Consotaella salsifontis]|uniref:Transposase n=1 Tax=Consotaella salsifontis TaxID=1365950 RepID=A0A1T4TAD2_9HYPH|nr:transposase [Consotaella salsifontis]
MNGLTALYAWQTPWSALQGRKSNAPPPDRQEDMATELKRLRRENAVLRQEREILKKAAAFFAREGSR